jgi:hypothetical protein
VEGSQFRLGDRHGGTQGIYVHYCAQDILRILGDCLQTYFGGTLYTEIYSKAEEDLEEALIIGGVHHPDSVVINDFYFKTGA